MSSQAADAARLLGMQVRVHRQLEGLTMARLASIAEVSERTVRQVERGDANVALGNALNVATAAGVPLFDETDPRTLARMRGSMEKAMTLIPSNVRNRKEAGVSTDF